MDVLLFGGLRVMDWRKSQLLGPIIVMHQCHKVVTWRVRELKNKRVPSARTRDISDYRLDRIEGAAIVADPETPGIFLTCLISLEFDTAVLSSSKYFPL
jgi:hypothetical protein